MNAAHGQVVMKLTLAVLPHGERDLRRLPPVSIGNMQLHRADANSVLAYLVLSRTLKGRRIVQNLGMNCNMTLRRRGEVEQCNG